MEIFAQTLSGKKILLAARHDEMVYEIKMKLEILENIHPD